MTAEEEAAYAAGREEFASVCRRDLNAEKQWPKAAAAIGAAMLPFKARIKALEAENEQLRDAVALIGRTDELEMTANRT